MTVETPRVDTAVSDEADAIRAMVVDSHEAMREGLRMMLSGDERITVIGAVGDGQEAVSRIKELSPDVVVMDIAVPGTDGIEAIRRLKEARSNVGIIVLSDDRKCLVPAIKAGAVGFLSRDISRAELAAAIQLVYLWRLVLFQNDVSHFALVRM
jgi:DNA-binding NarL/FixJ family response regulator